MGMVDSTSDSRDSAFFNYNRNLDIKSTDTRVIVLSIWI